MSDIFDVAKWSESDIVGVMDGMGINLFDEEHDEFVKSVIDTLSDRFDASVGINWGVIELAVEYIGTEEGLLK